MSTTKMRAPEGFEYSVVSTEYGNATVDPSGYVVVDSRSVPSLIKAGFHALGTTRTLGGRHSVTADEASDGAADIATGLTSVDAQIVQVLRGGAVVTGDVAVSVTGGVIVVENGATFDLTDGDVINWVAHGTDVEA